MASYSNEEPAEALVDGGWLHLTYKVTDEHKDTQLRRRHTRGSRRRRKRRRNVQRSNDYAPDLLTPYFIITVEGEKNTQLLICPSASSFSLPLPRTHSHTLPLIPAFTSLFFLLVKTSLSYSENLQASQAFFFGKWIPTGKKNINTHRTRLEITSAKRTTT